MRFLWTSVISPSKVESILLRLLDIYHEKDRFLSMNSVYIVMINLRFSP